VFFASKAEILSEQFQSVYTKENTSTMPDKEQSKYPSMKDIVINTKGVLSVLITSFMYFL
jgi:hypothetical protein